METINRKAAHTEVKVSLRFSENLVDIPAYYKPPEPLSNFLTVSLTAQKYNLGYISDWTAWYPDATRSEI